ncbi:MULTISPECIES: hypothetical protein [unclassified Variovorax]|uniref:hypothetical protein n=1 Tax=unclassified Variovorax TaxID=663243 RepID=UPI001BD61931|nr:MULTISPECIES: hypothetical protein [unclassified Variovorax]
MTLHTRTVATEGAAQARRFPTQLGEFVRVSRLSAMAPHDEWKATLADQTEIMVPEEGDRPNPLGVAKAIAVVQSRAYLGGRAVQLIAPFLRGEGAWRLLTIDFGVEARRYESEFLMCFAFVAANTRLSSSSPYFVVGFSQSKASEEGEPVFSLTVKAIAGIPFPV